jgi:hypothetical protein
LIIDPDTATIVNISINSMAINDPVNEHMPNLSYE